MADLTEDQKTIQSLKEQLATVTNERDTAKAELEQAKTIVADLKQKLSDKADGTIEVPSLKVGKEVYQFISDFTWKGEEVTLVRLKENAKLAEELVKEGVANLRLLDKKA